MKIFCFTLLFLFSIVVSAQDWKSNYKQAVEDAKNTNTPIVLVFAGSDWCAPCIKLDKLIWQSEDFKQYSKENYVLYKADFPRKKSNKLSEELTSQNRQLADKFNAKGYFPLVVILNSDEKVLGTTGYKKTTPKEYITLINNFIK